MSVINQNKKISQFTLATSPTNSDVFPIVNGGETKKLTLSGLTSFINQNLNIGNTVTGGTYDDTTGVITFTNTTGGTFDVTGFFKPSDDIYITGLTFNNGNYDLTINRNDGWSQTESLWILATDMTVTGGTYDIVTGTVTFTNNSGGTFNVTGFVSGYTDTIVTGFTYSDNTFSINDSTGGTFTQTVNTMTGLTITGNLSVSGLTASSIESGTISGTTATIDALTASTISATTYYGDGQYLTNISVSVSANTGIEKYNNTLYSVYNTTLDGDFSMSSGVGGLSAGTTVSSLTGKTLVQLFDDILFPVANPTYTIPTIAMSGPSTQTLEIGLTYSLSISVYGIKNDAGAFSQLRIFRNSSNLLTDSSFTITSEPSIPNQYGYSNPNNPNFRYTIAPVYSESYVIPAPVAGNSSTTTYYADGNYGSGLAKKNNKGGTDTRTPAVRSVNAPQASGSSFQSTVYTVTGIYPYFYGISATLPTAQDIANAISAGTATKVVSSASGTLSIPYNVSGNYIWFAYYSGYATKTVWYVNPLDNGSIDNSFITTETIQSVKSPQNYWSGINYKMHWSINQTIQSTIEFRNS